MLFNLTEISMCGYTYFYQLLLIRGPVCKTGGWYIIICEFPYNLRPPFCAFHASTPARLARDEACTARMGGEDQGCNWQRRAVHECVKSTLTGVSFFGVDCCACKMRMYSFVLECEVRRLKGDDIFLDKETFISLKNNYISHEWS